MKTPEEVFAALFAVQPLQESFRDLIQPKQQVAGMEYAIRGALGLINGCPVSGHP